MTRTVNAGMEERSEGGSSPVRDFGVGSVVGGSLGALGAVVSKFPVLPPTLRCGAVGGCIASCYLPITVPCTPASPLPRVQGARLRAPGLITQTGAPSLADAMPAAAALSCGAARSRRPGQPCARWLGQVLRARARVPVWLRVSARACHMCVRGRAVCVCVRARAGAGGRAVYVVCVCVCVGACVCARARACMLVNVCQRGTHAHSGYAAATCLAGVRASNVGIIAGAATGVGIFFGLEAFEGWRLRTGRAMLQVFCPPALIPCSRR